MKPFKLAVAVLCSALLSIVFVAACDKSPDEEIENSSGDQHHEQVQQHQGAHAEGDAHHEQGEQHQGAHAEGDAHHEEGQQHQGAHAEGDAHHEEGQHHQGAHAEGDAHQGHDVVQEDTGVRHDPPVAVAEVETGHWMCVMGDVHYSRPEEGDGRCPVCGMRLKQKTDDSDSAEANDDDNTPERSP